MSNPEATPVSGTIAAMGNRIKGGMQMAATETELERLGTSRKNGVLSVVHDRARQEAVEVEVYATSTCDEIDGRLIVSVQTGLPAAPAFALWDALSDAVQEWASTLPKVQEDIAVDLISLEVGWDTNSATF